ncbi:hypothetical protein BDY19DRAFT_664088 [Irpex rosettiformis]|uniref:Uncharacterized protein n=1 Tax=Irpex rosettiformis TaxID=378272 RepID=A0ACB8U9I7_9APHY|nr:hypothetical protein BDY19DRAFT_664088 [Irpex rosettiformis]
MGPNYYHMAYDRFMSLFATTTAHDVHDLSDEELKGMKHKFSGLLDGKSEPLMYPIICESLNEALNLAAQRRKDDVKYRFMDVADWPESSADDLKIDIAMYPNPDSPRAKETYNNVDTSQKAHLEDSPRLPHVGRNAWAWMTVGIEVKYTTVKSAFLFENSSLEEETPILRNSKEGKESQTQLSKYATEMMIRQHRTFVFIVYIASDQARLTRWDRVGCIVSTPINLAKESWKLLNFVYRLGLMSNDELGYDTTAVLATEEELKELIAFRPMNDYAAKRAKEIIDNRVYHPIHKVICSNELTGDTPHFIGKHSSASYSPTGRATIGYVTFNMRGKNGPRLSFRKDYWRPVLPNLRTELGIYELLKAKGVRRIATVIGGGDIANQRTVTQKYLGRRKLAERAHCHIFIEELARPLADYTSSGVMIAAVYHALEAHHDAWVKADILHRDISANNIMLIVNQDAHDDVSVSVRGMLIDWDLSKHRDDLKNEATQAGRSGTWAFMSAISLQYPLKPNELADDLESFIHVVTYLSLQWHHHDQTSLERGKSYSLDTLAEANTMNHDLAEHIHEQYEKSKLGPDGLYIGGVHKLKDNKLGNPPIKLEPRYASSYHIDLVNNLYQLLKAHYATIDFEALALRYSSSQITELATVNEGGPKAQGKGIIPAPIPDIDLELVTSNTTSKAPFVVPKQLQMQPPPTNELAQRTLDTHDAIIRVFYDALVDFKSRSSLPFDTTQDQFHGLSEIAPMTPKGASGAKRKSQSSANTGSKPKKAKSSAADDTKNVQAVSGDLYVVVEGKEDRH